MGHPQKSRKEQRRYTSALPGAQGLGACACSGSGGPLVLARGTFQRDSLRGGERFPRASSGQPHFERGWRPSSANCRRWERLDCSCVDVDVTPLMTIHPVRDAGVSMTFLSPFRPPRRCLHRVRFLPDRVALGRHSPPKWVSSRDPSTAKNATPIVH